jgi:redox-sensitive bicupin YhaK (pirin superfamily)
MNIIKYPKKQRGEKDLGWLQSNFNFSFSDYHNPTKSAFGTLVALNDDFVEPKKGFANHSHQNMEIISILLEGKMNHKDSMGNNATIEEGGVQIMSAGEGLFHEEWNIGESKVNFLQIWIQPKLQNVKPRYQQRHFSKEEYTNKLLTIVSSEEGFKHCWINQNSKISIGHFTSKTEFEYEFNALNKCLFVFCISGRLVIDENELNDRDAIGIWDTDKINIAVQHNCKFIIIETVINQK